MTQIADVDISLERTAEQLEQGLAEQNEADMERLEHRWAVLDTDPHRASVPRTRSSVS